MLFLRRAHSPVIKNIIKKKRKKKNTERIRKKYCLPHCYCLAADHLSPDVLALIKKVVVIVNLSKPLPWIIYCLSRCVDLWSEFKHVNSCSLKWPSPGKAYVVRRPQFFFYISMNEKSFCHALRFMKNKWMLNLYYFRVVLVLLNKLFKAS